jgi:hypothetical protein
LYCLKRLTNTELALEVLRWLVDSINAVNVGMSSIQTNLGLFMSWQILKQKLLNKVTQISVRIVAQLILHIWLVMMI